MSNTSISSSLEQVLRKALGQKALPPTIDDDTPLLGGVTGFDSLAVLSILTGIEQTFACPIAEHEVGAEVFETVGTLKRFVEERIDERG